MLALVLGLFHGVGRIADEASVGPVPSVQPFAMYWYTGTSKCEHRNAAHHTEVLQRRQSLHASSSCNLTQELQSSEDSLGLQLNWGCPACLCLGSDAGADRMLSVGDWFEATWIGNHPARTRCRRCSSESSAAMRGRSAVCRHSLSGHCKMQTWTLPCTEQFRVVQQQGVTKIWGWLLLASLLPCSL